MAPESTPESEEQPVSNLAPLDYLLQVMRGETGADEKTRLQAAALAAPFVHVKAGDRGKKDETADAAKKASTGRFAAPVTPPRLVVSR
jgi:phage terminase small subunit